ncbi:hypothetical protein CH371_17170 [Leptospira wolffii]|uniref:Uncharacterized protein n=1 Tax=Leptospira wolffii TaxID=409998 RepID=A0A2M9Z814_9LEPT|nr:hypothetical protein CH371_17170 [Leptospira wolffii]
MEISFQSHSKKRESAKSICFGRITILLNESEKGSQKIFFCLNIPIGIPYSKHTWDEDRFEPSAHFFIFKRMFWPFTM